MQKAEGLQALGLERRTLTWQGQEVVYCQSEKAEESVSSDGRSLVFIHGFGACKEHWRFNLPFFAQENNVYALDLIGFGESSKPDSVLEGEKAKAESAWRYGINSWAEQVVELVKSRTEGDVVLIGNSIGGVVASQAAAIMSQEESLKGRCKSLILIDCAQRQIDDKRLSEQPPFRQASKPLLKQLVRQRWFTNGIYRLLANRSIIKKVLKIAYPTGQNVDEDLVDYLFEPTTQENSMEAFRGFINLFDDLLAPDILAGLDVPTWLIWGEKDPWEPLDYARQWLSIPSVKGIEIIREAGHCPHDECPEKVNQAIQTLIEAGE